LLCLAGGLTGGALAWGGIAVTAARPPAWPWLELAAALIVAALWAAAAGSARGRERFWRAFWILLGAASVLNVLRPFVALQAYGDHEFLVMRMLSVQVPTETEQLAMFVGRNFVVTFQERAGDCFDEVRRRLQDPRGRVREHGAEYREFVLSTGHPVRRAHRERMRVSREDRRQLTYVQSDAAVAAALGRPDTIAHSQQPSRSTRPDRTFAAR